MFDRTFVINLDRRPDRWREFQRRFPAGWPFAHPELFSAVDGSVGPIPSYFRGGPGAWGCLQSHLRIWEQQVSEGLGSVLVLEDDAVFCRDAIQIMQETMSIVPADWHQVYFGGQHMLTSERPPEVVVQGKLIRCRAVNRTHAYAISREFAAEALAHIANSAWPYNERFHHIDYRLEELHDSHRVYAPWRFCIGQARGASDVRNHGNRPARCMEHFWNQFPIIEPAGVA